MLTPLEQLAKRTEPLRVSPLSFHMALLAQPVEWLWDDAYTVRDDKNGACALRGCPTKPPPACVLGSSRRSMPSPPLRSCCPGSSR
jgi:hypothetical protein